MADQHVGRDDHQRAGDDGENTHLGDHHRSQEHRRAGDRRDDFLRAVPTSSRALLVRNIGQADRQQDARFFALAAYPLDQHAVDDPADGRHGHDDQRQAGEEVQA